MAHGLLGGAYNVLPGSLQTLALNVYGLRNRRRQYCWSRILSELATTETEPPEQLVVRTATRLSEILGHAIQHVPRYQCFASMARELAGPPDAVFACLARFPTVTRAEILAEPGAFRSRNIDPRRTAITSTSGTTGTPFRMPIDRDAMLISDALWWRRTAWAGYRDGDWIARLVGDPVVPLGDRGAKPYRVSHVDRRLYLSTYHLSATTAPRMADQLARRRPAFLMGYPSALGALAVLAQGVELQSWRPKAILYSSEPLYAHQREALSRWIDAPVRGLYGCAERVVSAAECAAGSYHVGVVDGFVEGQFGEGRRAAGPITGLLSTALPLIRYELGDALEFVPGACDCGRTLPRISPVITKQEDNVVTPGGRVISPSILTWAFKDLVGVRRSQIIQTGATTVEVLVEVDDEHATSVARVLRRRITELLFDEMSVDVRAVRGLECTAAGKTRFVVNRSSHEGDRDR